MKDKKIYLLPTTVFHIIRKIRQKRLINIENPNIFPVSVRLEAARVKLSFFGDSLHIDDVTFTHQVMINVIGAFSWNGFPWSEIVCLRRESPARAM